MEKKSSGRPKGYRKPNPKKGKYFRLSGEEEFEVRKLLKRMRRKDKLDLPYINDLEYICLSEEINVLPKKIYSLEHQTEKDNLPDFQTYDIIDETGLSYIIKYNKQPVKISKKTLTAHIKGKEIKFFQSYKAALCYFLITNSDLISVWLYDFPYTNFADIMRNIWKYDKILMLEYIYRVIHIGNFIEPIIDELDESID